MNLFLDVLLNKDFDLSRRLTAGNINNKYQL